MRARLVAGRALSAGSRAGAGAGLGGVLAGIKDRIAALRTDLVARPSFRERALSFLPFRRLAQREASALFDLCAGFVYSQVLAATVELDVVPFLRERPRSVPETAAHTGLSVAATDRLLRAATALGLVREARDGRYAPGRLGAALIDNPGVVAMIRHHRHLYRDLSDPVALLAADRRRETDLGRYWRYAGQPAAVTGLDDDAVAAYSALMSDSQRALVAEILAAYPFDQHLKVLDVGGGEGSFACALAERFPHLKIRLFDLPPVAERARARIARAGLTDRVEAIGGSFASDPLPGGADLVSLVRIAHDHDDAVVERLFAAIFEALQPGGVLLLAEPLANTPGFERMGDAYFGMYLFAMGSGRPRTAHELTGMLRRAGFGTVAPRRTRMPLEGTLIVARKGEAAS